MFNFLQLQWKSHGFMKYFFQIDNCHGKREKNPFIKEQQ